MLLQNNSLAEKLYSALTDGYKEEVRWWGAWDLLRRLLLITIIVALPGRTVSYNHGCHISCVQSTNASSCYKLSEQLTLGGYVCTSCLLPHTTIPTDPSPLTYTHTHTHTHAHMHTHTHACTHTNTNTHTHHTHTHTHARLPPSSSSSLPSPYTSFSSPTASGGRISLRQLS